MSNGKLKGYSLGLIKVTGESGKALHCLSGILKQLCICGLRKRLGGLMKLKELKHPLNLLIKIMTMMKTKTKKIR